MGFTDQNRFEFKVTGPPVPDADALADPFAAVDSSSFETTAIGDDGITTDIYGAVTAYGLEAATKLALRRVKVVMAKAVPGWVPTAVECKMLDADDDV